MVRSLLVDRLGHNGPSRRFRRAGRCSTLWGTKPLPPVWTEVQQLDLHLDDNREFPDATMKIWPGEDAFDPRLPAARRFK